MKNPCGMDERKPPKSPGPMLSVTQYPRRWLGFSLGAGVFLVTVLVYVPCLFHGFVNWDDHANIFDNPGFRGLGPAQLGWMFTTFHLGPYQPLSWLTLGLDYALWGLNPLGYHLTNIILHAACAAAFFAVSLTLLRRITPGDPDAPAWRVPVCAAVAALVFSLHPLRVESVAWISERRDPLSGVFYLLSVNAYLRGIGRQGWLRRHLPALASFTAALLAKAIVISLPFALLALDYFPLRRLPAEPRRWLDSGSRGVWIEKIPYLLLALAAGIAGYIGQARAGATLPLADWGLGPRLSLAAYSLVFYLGKTVWPAALSPLYEAPRPALLWHWPYWGAALIVAALTVLAVWNRRRWPAGVALWVFYGASVGPVLGLVKLGEFATADRYTYLSCLGWAVLAGSLLAYALRGRPAIRIAALFLSFVLCVLLGLLTSRQTAVWRTSETLWRHALAYNQGQVVAATNLGNVLAEQGRLDEAVVQYTRSIRNDPRSANSYANLGNALSQKGMAPQAMAAFRQALKWNPAHVQAQNNLAVLLAAAGEFAAAEYHFRAALHYQPGTALAHLGLAKILSSTNRLEEARREYLEALRLDPKLDDARAGLESLQVRAGRAAEGMAPAGEDRHGASVTPAIR